MSIPESYFSKLKVQNFRKFDEIELSFGPEINVLIGPNGTGKTSILEAIYYLNLGKSFRTTHKQNLIKDLKMPTYIELETQNNKQEADPETHSNHHFVEKISKEGKNEIIDNQKNIAQKTSSSNTISQAKIKTLFSPVLFSLDHLTIVQGSPNLRRELFDQLIGIENKEHLKLVRQYEKFRQNKNQTIKLIRQENNSTLSEELKFLNHELAQLGGSIIYIRLQILKKFSQDLSEIYSEFTNSKDTIDISYQPSFLLKEISPEAISDQLESVLAFNQELEIKSNQTLFGPHRDDFVINLNSKFSRENISLGEQWTLALALKILEYNLKRENSLNPYFLLDDVFAIIDDSRQEKFLDYLQGSTQSFISTTNHSLFEKANSKQISINYLS